MWLQNKIAPEEIFKNCLNLIIDANGYMLPVRFTENQFKVYDANEAFRIRSYCPAGVCMDFHTDSDSISFEFAVEGRARGWLYFDFYLNGKFAGSHGGNPFPDDAGECSFKIFNPNRNKNRLTVYLPQNAVVKIRNITLSKDAFVKATDTNDRKILFLGDSITQGMEAIYPASSYVVRVARHYNAAFLNQGVGGYYFNAGSIDKELDFKPNLIIVAYGTNDWGRFASRSVFFDSVYAYLSELSNLYPGIKKAVITPIWRSDLQSSKPMGAFTVISETIAEVCKKLSDMKMIDGLKLVPNDPMYFGDAGEVKLHPTDEGFSHYAENLIDQLGNIFK